MSVAIFSDSLCWMFSNVFLLPPTEHTLCAYLGDIFIKPKLSYLITGLNSPSCVTHIWLKDARAVPGSLLWTLAPGTYSEFYLGHGVHQVLFFPGFSYILGAIKGFFLEVLAMLYMTSLSFNTCLNFPDVPKTSLRWVTSLRHNHVNYNKGIVV